ncbi:MAG: hypothetical protein FWF16_09125, partial [Microbacteriaceae bacterium]|nr:hypothetical protein [Microbacteriaceae bacterium]
LVYRVIAKLLAIGIDDRHTWHVVPAPVLVSDDDFATVWSLRELFPSLQPVGDRYLEAASALAEAADDGVTYWHEPLWTLLRDMEPVAVLDEAGVAHLPRTSPVDLMEAYDNVERDINPVVGFLLIKTAAANRLPSPELARPERNTEKFTTGESGFVAVQLLGGPLDQKKYGDVPVMSDGVPPLSIAIPLGKDPSEFATYVRLGLFDDLWRYAHQDDAEAPEEGTPMRPVKASQMIYVTNNFTRLFRYRSDRRWENERWDSTSGRWVGVGDYAHDKLFQADPNFDEISEDQARDHFPDAFNLEQ